MWVEGADDDATSAAGDAGQLGDGDRWVGHELEHGDRDGEVEGPVGERKVFDDALGAAPSQARAGQGEHAAVGVDAGQRRDLREHAAESAGAAAGVQDSLSGDGVGGVGDRG